MRIGYASFLSKMFEKYFLMRAEGLHLLHCRQVALVGAGKNFTGKKPILFYYLYGEIIA